MSVSAMHQNAIYRPGLAMPALVKTTSPTSLNHWESAESSCLTSGCESRVADLRKRMRDWEEEECFEC